MRKAKEWNSRKISKILHFFSYRRYPSHPRASLSLRFLFIDAVAAMGMAKKMENDYGECNLELWMFGRMHSEYQLLTYILVA